ncbi:MAG TPA: hypothetical protein VGJ91_03290, partial [Polyangiaceae bacterium]
LHGFGLSADDIALVYKHDTSTAANDPNENELHHRIQLALGRTPGNPLFVVSQKSLTGHSKGAAAAWQLNGLCQSLVTGTVPGNRNLESVDVAMQRFDCLTFTDRTLRSACPFKAGLVTSLGFGHVSAVVLVLHPDAFRARIPEADRARYRERVAQRQELARRNRSAIILGREPLFSRPAAHFAATGPEEAEVLLSRAARLSPGGTYQLESEP